MTNVSLGGKGKSKKGSINVRNFDAQKKKKDLIKVKYCGCGQDDTMLENV